MKEINLDYFVLKKEKKKTFLLTRWITKTK